MIFFSLQSDECLEYVTFQVSFQVCDTSKQLSKIIQCNKAVAHAFVTVRLYLIFQS